MGFLTDLLATVSAHLLIVLLCRLGLAVGVGFGSIGRHSGATFQAARNLAVGIGLQNFPEGETEFSFHSSSLLLFCFC